MASGVVRRLVSHRVVRLVDRDILVARKVVVSRVALAVDHDSVGADPGISDVLRGLLCAQRPGYVAAVAILVIPCPKRDLALALERRSDLTMQRLQVALHGQQDVGSQLLELTKNRRWVWSASAWMMTPSRSSSPRSCRSTARSWLPVVA